MKSIYKLALFTGIDVMAFGLGAKGMLQESPSVPKETSMQKTHAMTENELRATEASHLVMRKDCKWGHAAFDPCVVVSEVASAEVMALHSQMELA